MFPSRNILLKMATIAIHPLHDRERLLPSTVCNINLEEGTHNFKKGTIANDNSDSSLVIYCTAKGILDLEKRTGDLEKGKGDLEERTFDFEKGTHHTIAMLCKRKLYFSIYPRGLHCGIDCG